MAKRLISLAIFSLFLLVFLSTPQKSLAFLDAWGTTYNTNVNSVDEYCKLRSGNQMNLETWYSGKCKGTFQERLGFSDIVFMDIISSFSGAKDSDGHTSAMFLPFGTFISEMINSRPASSTQYFAYVSQNLAKHSIIPSAYAAGEGFGFRSLGPVLGIWKIFRDIVYLLFIIVFVIYGFMIMFRMKISAQAVVSIQTAIPTIIVSLLLVTFSYAIVGLIIDLSFLIQEVILNAFFNKMAQATITLQFEFLGFKPSVTLPSLDPLYALLTKNDHTAASVYIGRYGGIFMPLIYILIAITVGDTVSKIVSVLIPSSGVDVIDNISRTFLSNPLINIIVWLVLFIAVFYTFFKIIYMLIQAFVMLIIQTIFAPFILIQDIFPGRDAFGNWVRGIFANIIVFPATTFCFLLSFIFMGPITVDSGGALKALMTPLFRLFVPSPGMVFNIFQMNGADFNGAFSVPPPLGGIVEGVTGAFGAQGGLRGDSMMALIGIGIFLMTPKIAEAIQEALKVPAFKYGSAIGEALNYGYGPVGAGINMGKQAAGEAYQLSHARATEDEVGRIPSADPNATERAYDLRRQAYWGGRIAEGLTGAKNRIMPEKT